SADTSNGGAAKVQAAVAATARDEFGGLGRLGFFLHNQTGGSLTEHVSITPDGKVGIGTTVPSDSLTVDDGIIHARSSQSGTTGLGTDKGIALTAYGMNTSSKYTPGVLFGSRDPQFTTTNPKYNAGIYGVATETYGADTDTGMDLEFRITWIDQGTGHGLVQSGGYRMGTTSFYPLTHDQSDLGTSTLSWDDVYATSGTVNTSDERDKANIADLDLGLAFVDSLRPVSYTWNDRSGYVGTRTHMGFVAQEVATSLGDEAVNRGLWINSPTVPLDPENPEGEQSVERQGLRYHQLLAPMVKAIQELSATVQTLTARIEALETN
ncbi:MAG: tail fiber domain-containing protein, partial [Opitutae bacterium]